MSMILSFLPVALVLCLFAWFLRLGGKWGIKNTPSWKLSFIYAGIAALIAILGSMVYRSIAWSPGVFAGVAAQFCFGSWFFGRYLTTQDGRSVKFVCGAKLMAVAMLLMIVSGTSLVLIGMLLVRNA